MNYKFTLILIGLNQSMTDINADFKDMKIFASTMAEAESNAAVFAKTYGMRVCVLCQDLTEGERSQAA